MEIANMDRTNIFNRLIKTEDTVQDLYRDALSRQATLAEDLSELKAHMRTQMYAEADASIKAEEEVAAAEADDDIAALDKNLQASLKSIRQRYDENHQAWSDKIFYSAISKDSTGE